MSRLRVMCVTAHPDDECGAFGGALMLAKARGAETSVLCLTEGRAASYRGTTQSGNELARVRREEFAAGLRVLGVDRGEVLHYPDGHLVDENFSDVVKTVVEHIRRFRPHVILTFGGDGGVNLHPDHMMASFFATAAFHWAGRKNFAMEQIATGIEPYRPQKLYYSSPPFLIHGEVESTGEFARVPASLTLSLGDLKSRKYEAFQQHRTQAPLLEKVRDAFERFAGEERYLLAGARRAGIPVTEADMFDGVTEDPEENGN